MIQHVGIVLEPDARTFDAGATTFGCAFVEEDDPNITYFYYSGSKDTKWTHASIGLAVSKDGERFKKITELNPILEGEAADFNSRESVTPAVVRVKNHYYMFFAGGKKHARRRIGVAYSDDPRGPWKNLGVIAQPEVFWEGSSIDLGPNIVKINEEEIFVFYSNVNNKSKLLNMIYGVRYLTRRIGILKVKINSPNSIDVLKYRGNPLKKLNGSRGGSNESLFCPGYLSIPGEDFPREAPYNRHFLFPTMSTYSVGFPYYQYIGLVSDDNPYFKNVVTPLILIDGPSEKKDIISSIKSEIALDTPCPIIRDDEIYLYYAAMDRHDGIWKTALSIIAKTFFEKMEIQGAYK